MGTSGALILMVFVNGVVCFVAMVLEVLKDIFSRTCSWVCDFPHVFAAYCCRGILGFPIVILQRFDGFGVSFC